MHTERGAQGSKTTKCAHAYGANRAPGVKWPMHQGWVQEAGGGRPGTQGPKAQAPGPGRCSGCGVWWPGHPGRWQQLQLEGAGHPGHRLGGGGPATRGAQWLCPPVAAGPGTRGPHVWAPGVSSGTPVLRVLLPLLLGSPVNLVIPPCSLVTISEVPKNAQCASLR